MGPSRNADSNCQFVAAPPPILNFLVRFRHIDPMLTLIQFPWSPFCITVRRMLERNGIPFRLRDIPFHDRASEAAACI